MNSPSLIPASQWERAFAAPTSGLRNALASVYGTRQTEMRRKVILRLIQRFLARFGDRPVAVYRSPGRINLRGMHVDSHGGFLNLMTHQKETVVVASETSDGRLDAINVDESFPDVSIDMVPFLAEASSGRNWPDVIHRCKGNLTGGWADYVAGCVTRANWDSDRSALRGLQVAVAGDVPSGAGLSSSSSLCTALYGACAAIAGHNPSAADWIRGVRGAEWMTGARIGTSDQGAMVLGRAGAVLHAALPPDALDDVRPSYVPFPDGLTVLVVKTYTTRNLRGEHLLAYTQNRFAYAMALDVLRMAMIEGGYDDAFVEETRTLGNLRADRFEAHGGNAALYDLILQIPESIHIEELRQRYPVDDFDEAYVTYLSGVPEDQRPNRIRLRGPLLFGVAESERARVFAERLAAGDGVACGALMYCGHNGDRVVAPNGAPWQIDVSDHAIRRARDANAPVWQLPGAYGASSPVLDAVVDEARAAGALGACLTGAGIAGSVLVLCEDAVRDSITAKLSRFLTTKRFAQLRGQPLLSDVEAESAVTANVATAGAGLVPCP